MTLQIQPTYSITQFSSRPGLTASRGSYAGMNLPADGFMLSAKATPRVAMSSMSPTTALVYQTAGPNGYPISCWRLSNGHQVLIEQRPTDLVSLRTFINAGSILENPVKPSVLYPQTGFKSGIAHLDEHFHFLATKSHPEMNQWVKQVEQYGTSVNASTMPEMIQHEMTFNVEDLPQLLSYHAEAILEPLYAKEHLAQEKNNVINEMSERSMIPAARVGNALWDMVFDRPAFQTLGKPEDVKATSSEDVRQFYYNTYTPKNMLTVISGNISPQEVLPIIEQTFGNNPVRDAYMPQAGLKMALMPGQIKSKTVYDPELNFSMINVGFPAPNRKNIKDRVALECLDYILANRTNGLLSLTLKEKTALASNVLTGYMPMKHTGLFEVVIHTQPGKEQECLGNMLGIMGDIGNRGIAPETLQQTKTILASQCQKRLENAAMSSSVIGEEVTQGDLGYYTNYLPLLQSISPEDIQRVAQQYLSPKTYAVAFGVPGHADKRPGNPFAGDFSQPTQSQAGSQPTEQKPQLQQTGGQA